ncbi:AbrB family transcriptional regulator [Pseudokineococcus sp. 1T1Z-3]|uniref:AbrB family transcriptional regulator n=1 Tax=Pseudokineococcus sp. 1T1Z-3 TaxID=3132745 RepID=UPI00309B9B7B
MRRRGARGEGPPSPVPWWRWAVVVLLTALVGGALELGGVPSGVLFGGLLVGVVAALSGLSGHDPRGPRQVPRRAALSAQAVLGVLVGTLVQPGTLTGLASDWAPVVLVVLLTLGISVLAGVLLGRHRDVDPLTGAFALTAGGASGLVAMAGDLGADQRLVAVIQYLRVLVITASLPLVLLATGVGTGQGDGADPAGAGAAPLWAGVLLVAVVVPLGRGLGRLSRVPSGTLLGPLVLSAVLSGLGVTGGAQVPFLFVQVAYGVIGLQAGLAFTRETVVVVRRVLPAALVLVAGVIAACAGLGALLSALTGTTLLDGYLATTPGGLYAVIAASVATGSDVTFVLAVQVLRLLAMLVLAPAISRLLARRRG